MAAGVSETNLRALLTVHDVSALSMMGRSTSCCVRATMLEELSRGHRMARPTVCVADRHESPHFANLYDIAADVLSVEEVAARLAAIPD